MVETSAWVSYELDTSDKGRALMRRRLRRAFFWNPDPRFALRVDDLPSMWRLTFDHDPYDIARSERDGEE